MKVSYLKLVEADQALDFIVKNNKLKFENSWKIMELRDQWKKHMKIYNLEKDKIFDKFATDNGMGKQLPDDKLIPFEKEVLAYLDQDVEIPAPKKIPFAMLKNCEIQGSIESLRDYISRKN